MIDYTVSMIARMEHEQRIRSLAPVPEYGNSLKADQPRWVAIQAGRLLHALGSGLASIRERMKHQRSVGLDIPPAGQQESGALR
jgi:hypothetical protein